MTNEEAIVLIGSIQFDLTDGYYQREDYTEALCVFDRLNQENTKFKSEIEELEIENVCANHVMDKLKAENEMLKELMPKICETCEYEDEIGYEEPCNSCNNRRNWKLKSEE